MSVPLGNLPGSSPSIGMIGWGTSIAIHAVGVVVGMVCAVPGPIEHSDLPGNTTRVELVAGWTQPQDASPLVEVVPTVPRDTRPVESQPIDAQPVAPVERELCPMDVDVHRPIPELAMIEDPMPLPALAVPRRAAVALPGESPQVVASPPPLPRRITAPSLPHVEVPHPVPAPPIRPPLAVTGAGVDQLPRKLQANAAPAYPPDAFARRQQGRVLLEVHLSARGLVEDISIATSSGVATLDQAALDAVRRWRFEPARRDGVAVPIVVIVPIRFAIQAAQ